MPRTPPAAPKLSFFARLFRREPPAPPPRKIGAPQKPFQAVSVIPGLTCCFAAKKMIGKRFLARNAPPLPLTNCSKPGDCACRYAKHPDRRMGSRRISEIGIEVSLYSASEKRGVKDRRGVKRNAPPRKQPTT